MKKAAIVVGKRNAGKSTTIRHFKAMVTMETSHKFTLNGKRGYILACSFEEVGRDIESTVKKYSGYDFLVFACQGPMLSDVHNALKEASFSVRDVAIKTPSEASEKATDILNFFI